MGQNEAKQKFARDRFVTPRSDLPDIARGSLMLLVVWGHLMESRGFDGSLYFGIYIFHIPGLAMISGMFSKPRLDASEAFKICRRLIFPLLVFQILYYLALVFFAPDRVEGIFVPAWITWFLFSLVTWKFLLPAVLKLPYPFLISLSAALAAGFIDKIGLEFSLSRTFVFFPAFLFGHLYGKHIQETVKQHRIQFCVLFVAIFCAAFLVSDYINIRLLWGSRSYSGIPLETSGVIYRAIAIVIGIVSAVAFLAVIPSRSQSLALVGQNSISVYLFHGFPIILFWAVEIQMGSNFLFLLLTALLSLVISFSIAWITTLLSRKSKALRQSSDH